MAAKQCPKCLDIQIGEFVKYCHKDGSVLKALNACPHCDKEYLAHFKFCQYCGLSIKKKEDKID
jgi:hypothetical protein